MSLWKVAQRGPLVGVAPRVHCPAGRNQRGGEGVIYRGKQGGGGTHGLEPALILRWERRKLEAQICGREYEERGNPCLLVSV